VSDVEAAMKDLKPADLNVYIGMIIRDQPGKWLTPHFIWDQLQRLTPEIAEQVVRKVQTYEDPKRNNEVWFISNTLDLLGKTDEFELSDTDKVPEMRASGVWWIIRKKA
jgi:hypothetical protein